MPSVTKSQIDSTPESESTPSSSSVLNSTFKTVASIAWLFVLLGKMLPLALSYAHKIRLFAIEEYGPIIHEFDPYFNFRATEYLYEHGWGKFSTWFDYKSWYPLGRPVGTTIYPGMQVTAVWIKNHVVGGSMSLNDVCVYIPVWFGVLATFFTGLLAYECSLPVVNEVEAVEEKREEPPFGSILSEVPIFNYIYDNVMVPVMQFGLQGLEYVAGTDFGLRQITAREGKDDVLMMNSKFLSSPALECGLGAAFVMSILPAHLMRSVGGGFDNECIAMAAMVCTFWCWTRSLRGGVKNSGREAWKWGIVTGIAYFYMVAAWGGYIFVLNLIGAHTAFLVLAGRYSTKLHRAYTAFYIVGTALAIQVPVVGLTPLKSLEQLAPCLAFLGLQVLEVVETQRKKRGLTKMAAWKFRINAIGSCALIGVMVLLLITPTGYFGPISSRVRGLFVKHTKTGNPLVDSVAEHQPASPEAYSQWLGKTTITATLGFVLVALRHFHDSSSFLLVYAICTYFFSNKMVRLILLTAPIASALTGVLFGRMVGFVVRNILGFSPSLYYALGLGEDADKDVEADAPKKKTKKVSKKGKRSSGSDDESNSSSKSMTRSVIHKLFVACVAQVVLVEMSPHVNEFKDYSFKIAKQMSHPSIIQKGTLQDGTVVTVDDYRECYNWLRQNTPEDSRVLAWWDYGYQISAMGNRTTIADGNTWNHEHIALLGRILTGSEKDGHRIARHLADYVLLWTGGGGDDLAKSPHLARIANSVYRSMCPGDPTCSQFTMTKQGPSQMMRESLLFNLHSHGIKEGVSADPNRFKFAFQSKYGKCRIFKVSSVSQESKAWAADPKNRLCDVEGGWYCRGQYPPALQKVLNEKKDFSQLEDFNKKSDDSEYQKQYFENLGKKKAVPAAQEKKQSEFSENKPWKPSRELSNEEIGEINGKWENNEITTQLWQLIDQNRLQELLHVFAEKPENAHMRSEDGRGPMWWAFENKNEKVLKILRKLGVSETLQDVNGLTPRDMLKQNEL